MYFERMIESANRRLRAMTDGRYELVRRSIATTKAAQSGLDLNVRDNYTGKERDSGSLSGGESFKASLALALGLSAIAQSNAGGIKLDTMFIDEGSARSTGNRSNSPSRRSPNCRAATSSSASSATSTSSKTPSTARSS